MLSCIALGFCKHIACSLRTVNIDRLRVLLKEDASCFKLEDSFTLLAPQPERSLSPAAIKHAWQSFMQTIVPSNEEVRCYHVCQQEGNVYVCFCSVCTMHKECLI
ncbi:hypothetical protein EON63_20595 [archaeon]|nr:MAG: hypothetical protein EON63_20595 [archaeon]